VTPLYKGLTARSCKGSLSENQEDKLVSLKTLQGVVYTTRHKSLTCYDAYIFFLISHPFLDIYDL
jgi:hypothetical protein